MKSIFSKVCFPLLLVLSTYWAPAATAQDFVRTQIGTVNYTSPLFQQRYSSQAFNPPLIFEVGTSAAQKNVFQIVGLTPANTHTFAFTAPAQATVTTFPDPGAATATINYAVFTNCGTAAACSPTTISTTAKITIGTCPASSATTCTVTGISPAYTSSTSYTCGVTDGTTAANNALKITYVSGTSFTITTASSSDVFSYVCAGT